MKNIRIPGGAFLVYRPFAARTLAQSGSATVDYTLHIKNAVVEIAPKHFVPVTTYSIQFPPG